MAKKKAGSASGQNNQPVNITPFPGWVQDKLHSSGIPPDVASAAGIRFIPSDECARILGRDPRKKPTPDGIWIPYFDIDGKPIIDNGQPYGRIRFQGNGIEVTDGKYQRYTQPPGTSPHVYIPPGFTEALKHFPAHVETEGELKALSATAAGIPTIAVGGIQSWSDPEVRFLEKQIALSHGLPTPRLDHESPLHPELRTVIEAAKKAGIKKILFLGDSDGRVEYGPGGEITSGNPAVEAAVKKLAKATQWQSGDVEVFRSFCPHPRNKQGEEDPDRKMGLDDWIVSEGPRAVKEALLKVLSGKWARAISFGEKEHLPLAKWFRQKYQVDGTPGLVRWREDFYQWTGSRWEIVEEKRLQADLHNWLDGISIFDKKEGTVPPTRALLENVFATMERVSHLPTAMDAPFLLSDPPAPIGSGKFIVLEDGVLNIETREFFPPSIELFAPNVLSFSYNAKAACPEWERFLSSLWPNDPEAIRLLRQWVGYLLSGSTHLQKILFLIGPKRAGKGTLLRVLSFLLGVENVSSLSLGKLGSNFGLASLLGKSLAFFPDARLTGTTEQGPIVETLLSISGEDSLPVDRKYRDVITAKIPARLILVSNELPRIQDASGALASRFLILKLTRSFFGAEDHDLADRLLRELPGILNWGLSGLDDLKKTGRFIEPLSGKELSEDMHRLASPVGAFVSDCCLVGPNFRVRKTDLFLAWKQWTEENGQHAGSMEMFSRNLKAAVQVRSYQPPESEDPKRLRCWIGIGLTGTSEYDYPEQPRNSQGTSGPYPQTRIRTGWNSGNTVFEKDSFQEEEEGEGNICIEVTNGENAVPGVPANTVAKLTCSNPVPTNTVAIPDDSIFDLDAFLREDA